MTGRERIYAALTGGEVDRPPLDYGCSFRLTHREMPTDELQWGWMREERFLKLREHMRPWCDTHECFEPPLFNRYMMVTANRITSEVTRETPDHRVIRGTIALPSGDVYYEDHHRRGFATDWHIGVPAEDLDVLKRLLDAPFEVDETAVRSSVKMLRELDERLGENGFPGLFLPSPAVAISHGMHLENFLEFCFVEEKIVLDFCTEITRRIGLCIDALLAENLPMCSFTFGGSEQFTPPMMHPESFDRFVVPFEGHLVKKLQASGRPVKCHCHGRVAYALKRILAMGYDAVDPIEPPPQGDITYAEARAIAGDRMTLQGNLELVEIERGSPEHMRMRIRELLSLGHKRLILADAGGLRQAVTETMYQNYRAMVDEYAAHFS